MAQIPYIEYNLILEYLYQIYRNKINSEDINISAFFEFNPSGGSISPVYEGYNPLIVHNIFGFDWFIIDLKYKEHKLWLFCRTFLRQNPVIDARPFKEYYIDYSLQQKGETLEVDLISILKKLALNNSRLKGKVLKINNSIEYLSILDLVETITPSKTSLDNIFLPIQKKEFINIFINTLHNYKGGNLRYLFNGQPGTAKTQIIHSIMNNVGTKATFVILENRNIPLNEVFNFCSIFEPCVLVIDDLDFLIEERNRANSKNELPVFLSNLDGFNYKNLFILATTNDKKFVDLAAQRPGRFDLIIDLDEIAPENYLNLIKRETNNEEIVILFNETRLNELASKRITGAFIVNLIKLLKTYKGQNGAISDKKLQEILSFSYNGFYKSNNKEKEIGFL